MAAVAEQTFVEHRGRIYLIPPQPFVVVPVRADTLPRIYRPIATGRIDLARGGK
jgi:hypothetical protein